MRIFWKVLKWVLLTALIGVGVVVLIFVGWNVAKGVAPEETCELYKSMVHRMAAPGFVPSDDCRWVKRDPIGHFTVNGEPFTVPREYLWQGGHNPDGSYDALYMMMRYPDMQAVPPDPYHDLNVMVTIRSTARHILCVNEGKCDQVAQSKYWDMSNLDWCEQGRAGCIYTNGTPENINFIPALGLKHFKSAFGPDDVFFKGEVMHPELWFVCDPPGHYKNPPCETAFQFNEHFFVEYRVRRQALGSQLLEVHEKVVRKLEEFMNAKVSAHILKITENR